MSHFIQFFDVLNTNDIFDSWQIALVGRPGT